MPRLVIVEGSGGTLLDPAASSGDLSSRLGELSAEWARGERLHEARETERSLIILRLADRRRHERAEATWRARQSEYDRLERERRLLVARARGAR